MLLIKSIVKTIIVFLAITIVCSIGCSFAYNLNEVFKGTIVLFVLMVTWFYTTSDPGDDDDLSLDETHYRYKTDPESDEDEDPLW